MKLAITSPAGKIGHKLVQELLQRGGHELVLLTPNEERVRDLSRTGVSIETGRLENPQFFTRATRNADALFFVLPMDSHSEGFLTECEQMIDNAVHAIENNNIERVVFVSSIGAHLERGSGPIALLRRAEERLRAAAPNLTVLRPVFYMDQLFGWMNDIAENGNFYVAMAPTTELPMVATRDVAAFAADVLTDTSWQGRRVVPLNGPRRYSFDQMADILSDVLGSHVEPVQVPPAEMAKRLFDRGWSEPAVERYLELQEGLAQGSIMEDMPRSQWVTQPTDFEEFARREFLPAYNDLRPVTTPRT